MVEASLGVMFVFVSLPTLSQVGSLQILTLIDMQNLIYSLYGNGNVLICLCVWHFGVMWFDLFGCLVCGGVSLILLGVHHMEL